MSSISDFDRGAWPTSAAAQPLAEALLVEAHRETDRIKYSRNHYEALAVPRSARSLEIQAAFKRSTDLLDQAMRELAPLFPGERLRRLKLSLMRVKEAYGILGDHRRRREYDLWLISRIGIRRPAIRSGIPDVTIRGLEIHRNSSVLTAVDRPANWPTSASDDAPRPTATRIYTTPRDAPPSESVVLHGRETWHPDDIDDAEANRRRSGRIKLALPARVTRIAASGAIHEMVRTVDVSKAGAAIMMKHRPKLGSIFHLSMPMPVNLRTHGHADPAYGTYVLVRRVLPPHDDERIVGVEFLGGSPPRGFLERPGATFKVDWLGENRRRFVRFSLSQAVAIQFLSKDSELITLGTGRTENVGRRGARIRLDRSAPEFELVKVVCSSIGFQSMAVLCRGFKGSDSRDRLCLAFLDNDWPLVGADL